MFKKPRVKKKQTICSISSQTIECVENNTIDFSFFITCPNYS